MTWAQAEPHLRRQAYEAINWDPNLLFECDGGPEGMTADVVMARLIGYEDEIVEDGLRIPRAEYELRVPLPQRFTFAAVDEPAMPMLRVARYVLQSNYLLTRVAWQHAPQDIKPGLDYTCSVLYLRYRRRA